MDIQPTEFQYGQAGPSNYARTQNFPPRGTAMQNLGRVAHHNHNHAQAPITHNQPYYATSNARPNSHSPMTYPGTTNGIRGMGPSGRGRSQHGQRGRGGGAASSFGRLALELRLLLRLCLPVQGSVLMYCSALGLRGLLFALLIEGRATIGSDDGGS